jgi:ElaB/YqjD/DUF883 family membrane-anchored ribosome-binding protein
MASSSRMSRINNLERLLQDLEQRLSRLNKVAARVSAAAPDTANITDMIATAFGTMAERFRGRAGTVARTVGGDVSHFGDEALQIGNDALRKLTREVERRPLITLAVAVGVGALAAGLLARRG